jgi:hypothetical protein
VLTNGRYLHGREWASGYKGRSGISTHEIVTGLVAEVFDSDPYYLAVYFVNGEPVAGESCIASEERWLAALKSDAAFQKELMSL